jgi:hypothetical protein
VQLAFLVAMARGTVLRGQQEKVWTCGGAHHRRFPI